MKIKKLERNPSGSYEILDLFDKVNEIIDVLNNSFITDDPDTVYGHVTDTLQCDRLTPLSNEVASVTLAHIQDASESVNIYGGISCPKCGARYFTVGPSRSTCVYYPPIIKDGVNINPDRNITTTTYECCNCGNSWEQSRC